MKNKNSLQNVNQVDFIDNDIQAFVRQVNDLAESASNFADIASVMHPTSASVADYLALMQSRLTLLKKDQKRIESKNQVKPKNTKK